MQLYGILIKHGLQVVKTASGFPSDVVMQLMVPAGSSWFLLVGFVIPTGLLTVSAASIIDCFVISNRGRLLGITDLMITKPINRNEERRNKRKQDMLKKETRSRLMLIEININVEDIDIDIEDHLFSPNSKIELFLFNSNNCVSSVKKWSSQNERKFTVFFHFKDNEISRKGLRVSRDSFAYKEYGIRLMLAPKSAKALQEKVLLKLHGIRKLLGSLSFGGTLF
ncbi:hypothetical protein Tco_0642292 [Tanacetum coccineum]